MKGLSVLFMTLMVSSIGHSAIITLGIVPAVSSDFRETMNNSCNRIVTYNYFTGDIFHAGELMACVGTWILGQEDQEILRSLEAAGTLQVVAEAVLSGQRGDANIQVPDVIIAKFGNEAVKKALQAYVAEITPAASSAE